MDNWFWYCEATNSSKNFSSAFWQIIFSSSPPTASQLIDLAQTKDALIKEKSLYQMRSFCKAYPTLPEAEKNLSWTHYRNLSAVKNDEKRQYLEELTINNNLGATKLQKEIKKLNKKTSKKKPLAKSQKSVKLSVSRWRLFTYKIATLKDKSKKFIDYGFNIFSEIKSTTQSNEAIVESVKKGTSFSFKKSTATSKQLHAYKAYLDKVVDGDTLNVTLDLGFKIQHREILRLAQINAP